MKDRVEQITILLENGEYEGANSLLQEWKETEDFVFDEKTAIIEGSILLAQNAWEEVEKVVCQGLTHDPYNGELYFILGQAKEASGNVRQAQFSYENAVYYCDEEDYGTLAKYYEEFCRANDQTGVSIILVTYNQLEITKLCVDSIRQNTPSGTYEIIIVDNASTDGTPEWLCEQKDIRFLCNEENKGFPAACNQGVDMAQEGNDIFLLNNDTIVMKNSIYTLHMALYEETCVGAVGSCSNRVGKRQEITEQFSQLEDYVEYARTHNIYSPSCHEKRLSLVGFALMVQRRAWEKVGGLDEIYGLGNFEDDDICLNLLIHDYILLFCPDSFIFHFGSQSFGEMKDEYHMLLQQNKQKFSLKWGVSWGYFAHVRRELMVYLPYQPEDSFSILDVGCGSGATLMQIGNEYPHADLYGIELNAKVASIASHYCNIVQGNIEDGRNPFDRKYDCIMLADVLEHLKDTKETLLRLKTWLKEDGCFIISLPNVMHISVIRSLLHGRFEYQDEGILDRTHLRFFTITEIVALMKECGLELEKAGGLAYPIEPADQLYLESLCEMDPSIPKEQMEFYQYRIRARLCK